MITNNIQLFYVLFFMIFLHIVDDFYLQGILANMKQKSWWRKQENYNEKYAYDFSTALMIHGFSWSFMMMLPLNILSEFSNIWLVVVLAVNFIIHCFVDNAKANLKAINLGEDQLIHLVQIFCTWCIGINFIM